MTTGYDKPLYVLPFDHRATFSKNLFGWQRPLNSQPRTVMFVISGDRQTWTQH
jgi:hypothetical protein